MRVAWNALVYALSNGLQRGATVLIMPLLLARLTVADYGRYGLLLSVYVLVTPIVSLGMYGAINRFYFDASELKRRQAITATLLLAHGSVIVLITTYIDIILSYTIKNLGGVGYDPYIRLVLWAGASTALLEGVLALWRAAEKSLSVAITQFSSFLLSTGAIAFLLLQRNLGLHGVVLGLFVGQATVSVTAFVVALSQTQWSWDTAVVKDALTYSIPLIPHLTGGWLLRASDRWILQHFRGALELGNYFFSLQLASVVSLLMSSTNDAVAPRFLASFRDAGVEGVREFHRRIFPLYCWVAVGLAAAIIIMARLASRLLSNGKVTNSNILTSLLVSAIVASVLYMPFANAFFALKKTVSLMLLTLSTGMLNVLLNLLLIPRWGAIGAAASMLCSYLVLLFSVSHLAYAYLGLARQRLNLAAATAILVAITWFISR